MPHPNNERAAISWLLVRFSQSRLRKLREPSRGQPVLLSSLASTAPDTGSNQLLEEDMHLRNAIPLGRIITAIALTLATASPARQAQDEQLFQQIFGKAQEKIGQAKTAQADILSPDVFARALKKYNEAKDDFKRGRSLTEINNKLREVNTDLDAAMNTAKLGKVALASGLQARDAALQSNAPKYAQEKYTLADKAFT